MNLTRHANFTAFDAKMMTRALSLAEKGRYSTTPNPCVGCVIVDSQQHIIGEGFHKKAGEPHAEIHALTQAGPLAKGATAYVTLEPCAHYGRTGPCALALIHAALGKVIIACVDANPQVSTKGIQMLQAAGIEVQTGLLQQEAQALNRAFFFRILRRRPFVTVKLAASLDGKTALADGQSKWITSPQARKDVQCMRASSCAILTGADTVIADNPAMNVRPSELLDEIAQQFNWREKQPQRVIIDSQNRLSLSCYQMFADGQPCLVYNLRENKRLNDATGTCNVEQQQIQSTTKHQREFVDLNALFEDLADKQINHVWVEAGASLTGALFDLGLVDQLVLYQAPKILGSSARGLSNVNSPLLLANAKNGHITSLSQIGPDSKTVVSFTDPTKRSE